MVSQNVETHWKGREGPFPRYRGNLGGKKEGPIGLPRRREPGTRPAEKAENGRQWRLPFTREE